MGKFMLINANCDPQKVLKGGVFVSAVNIWPVENFHYIIIILNKSFQQRLLHCETGLLRYTLLQVLQCV